MFKPRALVRLSVLFISLLMPTIVFGQPLLEGISNELLLMGVLGVTVFTLLTAFLVIGFIFYHNLNFVLHSKPKSTDATS
ncbi:MAG: hypothetical protein ACFCUI_10065 [Bernardetiaceae bacterium]